LKKFAKKKKLKIIFFRIHDKLYDLNSFVEKHPGGKDWISLTKGVDITEYFETHHLYGRAEQLLPKYYVREAKLPRNYNFVFKPDGFYLTLKKRVMEILPKLDKSPGKTSDVSVPDVLSFKYKSFNN
jgi:cytochrome b involved in lipid metabolism